MARRQLRQNNKKPLIVICSDGGKNLQNTTILEIILIGI